MGLWSALLGRTPSATYSDIHNFWYQPLAASFPSLSGEVLTADAALRTSAVWACVNLLSRTQAMLPAKVYRDLDSDPDPRTGGSGENVLAQEMSGKAQNKRHPVARVFRRRPNAWQSPFEFRQFGMTSLLLRGNFYARKVYDPRTGDLDQLVPLHPDRVRAEQLESGRMGYQYRPRNGAPVALTQDAMYHVRGLSLDGVTGVSVVEYARQTIGKAIAQEGSMARFYQHGMIGRTIIKGPKLLSPTARLSLKADLEELQGWTNTGKTLLLEEGFEAQPLAVSARDAQFIEAYYGSVEDVCRWFGVQPHMIAHLLRATNNNIEQQSREYVTYSLGPWNVAFESAALRDLFEEDDEHYLEFLNDMLLRSDTLARFQAYAIAIMNGFMSENECRVRENLPAWPGLWEPRRSSNQDRGGDPRTPRPPGPASPAAPDDDDDAMSARGPAGDIALRAADRIVRKETAAIRRQAERGRIDRAWVADFYARHVETLTGALGLSQEQARRYGADHCAILLERGVVVLDEWEASAPRALLAMALTPKENGHHAAA